jgi:hypothetical protein
MLPTGNPKEPWQSIGVIGCVVKNDKEMRILYDDGSILKVSLEPVGSF